jgi:hypothetical protein
MKIKVLLFIILIIILYEIYLVYFAKKKIILVSQPKAKYNLINNNNNNTLIPISNNYKVATTSYVDDSYKVNTILHPNNDNLNNNIYNSSVDAISNNTIVNNPDNELYNNVDDINYNPVDNETNIDSITETIPKNYFGNPTDYQEGKYIVWEFNQPKPWTKIIYKNNSSNPFIFFIKVKIPSLNDYENWKKIIANIDFDPRIGEIILPTTDEESALSIINLMLTNFKGDISIGDIINKNLIDISIAKARKYDVVKTKIREQIIDNVTVRTKESFKDTETPIFKKDLAVSNSELIAYEGNEFSFI